MELPEDRPVEVIREIRRRVSKKCGHDLARLVEYYIRVQQKYENRLLTDRPDESAQEQNVAEAATSGAARQDGRTVHGGAAALGY